MYPSLRFYSPSKFKRLSKAKQRVLVAQDVLDQLAAQKFKPRRGTYITLDGSLIYDEDSTKDVKDLISESRTCTVCAKGALVCSYINRFNNHDVFDAVSIYDEDMGDIVDVFGYTLWAEIEAQFEGKPLYRAANINYKYGSKYIKKRGRSLKSLMQNIIKNNGKLEIAKGILIG